MAKSLADSVGKKIANRGPLWKGPEEDGVTQSLLGGFLGCRERFRLHVVEGLRPADKFNHRIEYGQMWHLCEEVFRSGGDWEAALQKKVKRYLARYISQRPDILKWYQVCLRQFPVYQDFWAKHKDEKTRETLVAEYPFAIQITLPSGRIVTLRGKWDEVCTIGKGKRLGVWLGENKTKGEPDETKLRTQLKFDIQVGIYTTALLQVMQDQKDGYIYEDLPDFPKKTMTGVDYNVIRRPLSGGRGTIKQKQVNKTNKVAETDEEYYTRLQQYFLDDPSYFFFRLEVRFTAADMALFRNTFLVPALENLCDWWEWVKADPYDPFRVGAIDGSTSGERDRAGGGIHYRYPYGVYNPTQEGKHADLDHYLDSGGSKIGLERVSTLYPELEEDDGEGHEEESA